MELVDVLDENGEIVDVKPRDYVHQNALWHPGVHLWIVNNNQVLIQKRSQQVSAWKGYWDISAAGHVSHGETYVEAVTKECNEELGILIDTSKLVELEMVRDEVMIPELQIMHRFFLQVFLIKMDVDVSNIKFDSKEVEQVKFIDLAQLREEVMSGVGFGEKNPRDNNYYVRQIDKILK